MTHFLLIDGNNVYIQSRHDPEAFEYEGRHRRVPNPCIEALEAIVAHCQSNKILFKLYFDSTSHHHFDWWARQSGEGGREVQRRYEALLAMGEERVKVAPARTQADMFKLADADALLRRGVDVRIVTKDKFRDRLKRYPDLLMWNDELGYPERCLPFERSALPQDLGLVFARLPLAAGGLHEVRLSLQSPQSPQSPQSHRASPAMSEACARAPTLVVDHIANLLVGGLRLYGNGQVFKLSLKRAALAEAEVPMWPVTVGRSDDQDFVVSDSFAAVSRRHLEFHLDDTTGRVSVTDTGSSNGTWLNSRFLAPGVATELPHGPGLITMVGSDDAANMAVHLFYEYGVVKASDDDAKSSGAPILHVRLPGGRELRFEIRSLPFTIGTDVSGEGASLAFPEVISVSREHLQILQATGEEGFLVKSLGRNGTSYHGVLQDSPFVLPYSDEVVLSPMDARTGCVALWITRS